MTDIDRPVAAIAPDATGKTDEDAILTTRHENFLAPEQNGARTAPERGIEFGIALGKVVRHPMQVDVAEPSSAEVGARTNWSQQAKIW